MPPARGTQGLGGMGLPPDSGLTELDDGGHEMNKKRRLSCSTLPIFLSAEVPFCRKKRFSKPISASIG